MKAFVAVLDTEGTTRRFLSEIQSPDSSINENETL